MKNSSNIFKLAILNVHRNSEISCRAVERALQCTVFPLEGDVDRRAPLDAVWNSTSSCGYMKTSRRKWTQLAWEHCYEFQNIPWNICCAFDCYCLTFLSFYLELNMPLFCTEVDCVYINLWKSVNAGIKIDKKSTEFCLCVCVSSSLLDQIFPFSFGCLTSVENPLRVVVSSDLWQTWDDLNPIKFFFEKLHFALFFKSMPDDFMENTFMII